MVFCFFIYYPSFDLTSTLLKMNVDKFGHHIHKRLRAFDIFDFRDKALLKKDSGEFDLQSSVLKGVKRPQLFDEAVNKEYLDDTVKKIVSEINDKILKIFNHLDTQFVTKADINKILEQKILELEKKSQIIVASEHSS